MEAAMSDEMDPQLRKRLEVAAEAGAIVRVTDPWGTDHNIDAGLLLEMVGHAEVIRAQLAESTKAWEAKLFPAEVPEALKGTADE